MEMCFLDALAVVTLRVGQTKEAFLEKVTAPSQINGPASLCGNHAWLNNALFLVPESKSNVLVTMCIRDACNAVLAPSKSSRAGVVVGEVYEMVRVGRLVERDIHARLQASPSGL